MGLCNQIHDIPIRYVFMIDYDKKHGKYPLTLGEKERLESIDINVHDDERLYR